MRFNRRQAIGHTGLETISLPAIRRALLSAAVIALTAGFQLGCTPIDLDDPIIVDPLLTCENSCVYAYDDECDEGSYCDWGTDCWDCTTVVEVDPYCDDSCIYAYDDECDEGSYCDWGTDCWDCGY